MLIASMLIRSYLLFQYVSNLRRPRETKFVNIIKMATKFIKTTIKDSKNQRNFVLKCNLYLYFLI